MKTESRSIARRIAAAIAIATFLGTNPVLANEKQTQEVSSDILKIWRDPVTGTWKSQNIESHSEIRKTAEKESSAPKSHDGTVKQAGKIG